MKMSRRISITYLLVLFLLSSGASLFAQEDPVKDFFASDELIELTITANFDLLLKERADKTYRPAKVSYIGEGSADVELEGKVRTRGYYRLSKSHCAFPPLKLKFSKKKRKGTIFENAKELKLVTHCSNRQKAFEAYVLEEFLIYKIYNELTDRSLKVRLAHITYLDSAGKRKPVTKYGFLIEDIDAMAKRLGGKEMEVTNIHQDSTDFQQMTLFTVFQYMIGNTDWSVPALHNVKLVSREDPRLKPFAVPYDFDHAGVINTYYAKPNPKLGIESVRDRLFRGYCRSEEELQKVFNLFNEKKDNIYRVYTDFPYLKPKRKKAILSYYDVFYRTINRPNGIKSEFMYRCRK